MSRTHAVGGWTSLIVATFLLSALMVAAMGCRTKDKAGVKDAVSDGIAATLPKGMVAKRIEAAEIAKYVAPGDGRNGVPHTIDGIWWTNAKTVHFVASFKNAYWDKDKRAASLLFVGPGTYTNRAEDNTPKDYLVPANPNGYEGYDIAFSEDGKMAWLLPAMTDDNNDRVEESSVATTPYTMEWKADNHWTRHSKGQPDYELRRIVDADGKPDPENFPLYLADWAQGAVVYLPTISLSDKQPSVEIQVTSDQPIYVNAFVTGFYEISNNGSVPVSMRAADKRGSSKPKAGAALNKLAITGTGGSVDDPDSGTLIVVTPEKGARGTLTLTAAPAANVLMASLTAPTTVTLPKDGTAISLTMPLQNLPAGANGSVYSFKFQAPGATSAVVHYDIGTIETKTIEANEELLIRIGPATTAITYVELSNTTGGGSITLTPTRMPVKFVDKTIAIDGPAVADKLTKITDIHCYRPSTAVPPVGAKLFYTLTSTATPPVLTVMPNKLGHIGPDRHALLTSGKYFGTMCVQFQAGLNQSAPLDYTLQLVGQDPDAGKS